MDNKIIIGGNVFGYSCNYKEAEKIIISGLDLGINQIDTADTYSSGNSEKIIGKIINRNKLKNKIKIYTKVGSVNYDFSNLNSKKNIYSKVDSSLKRLKIDCIDLYQLHNFDPITPLEETIESLMALKKSGKIADYGVSNFFKSNLLKIDKIKKKNLFNQLNLNILNIENEKLSKFCKIIAYGVLGRGVITDNFFSNKLSYRKSKSSSIINDLKNKKLKQYLIKLRKIAILNDLSLEQLAFNYIYNLKNVSKMIVGVNDIESLINLISKKNIKITKNRINKLQKLFLNDFSLSNNILGKFL